ncbi:MAG: hypothetical protein RO009_00255 [Pseudorhodoplanes sp.]|nr:hypothetical protein [Pseudorhodoplanes sp.]
MTAIAVAHVRKAQLTALPFEHSAAPRDNGRMITDITGATASRPVCAFPDRHYALVLREGASRFYWKLDNEGVTISGDLLRWEHDGATRERHFREIASVHLQLGHAQERRHRHVPDHVPRPSALGHNDIR